MIYNSSDKDFFLVFEKIATFQKLVFVSTSLTSCYSFCKREKLKNRDKFYFIIKLNKKSRCQEIVDSAVKILLK